MTGTAATVEAPQPASEPHAYGIGVLFYSTSDAVVVGDARSGRVVLWSPSAERIFGYSAHEALGMLLEEIVPPALKPAHRAGLERFVTSGQGPLIDGDGAIELPALHKSGAEITIELTLTRVKGPAPGPFVLAMVRDATERKRAEAERLQLAREQAARAEAEAAQRRAAFLADAGAVLASSLDYETTLVSVARLAVPVLASWCVVYVLDDDGAIRRLALEAADEERARLGDAIQRRFRIDPDAASGVPRVLRTGRPERHVTRVAAHLAADVDDPPALARLLDEWGISSWMCVPLVARGRTVGALSFVADAGRRYEPADLSLAEDLARRAALAIDNARLYREAQEAIRDRDRFLSIAAHELRTPVTTLGGYAQYAAQEHARGRFDGERAGRMLTRMAAAAERLAALTGDLLELSRIRLGQLPLRPEPTDLAALAHAVADRYGAVLDVRHRLVVATDPGLCIAAADPNRLEQVLTNLLDNAVKYSPGDGEIRLEARPVDDGVVLAVRDRGIGLPPGEAERIFERYGRASNAAEHGAHGLGLGLYLCRDMVERQGGRIWAESEGEGQGTTLFVWLPCAPTEG